MLLHALGPVRMGTGVVRIEEECLHLNNQSTTFFHPVLDAGAPASIQALHDNELIRRHAGSHAPIYLAIKGNVVLCCKRGASHQLPYATSLTCSCSLCTVRLEKCMKGRWQVMDDCIDNCSVRRKSPRSTRGCD